MSVLHKIEPEGLPVQRRLLAQLLHLDDVQLQLVREHVARLAVAQLEQVMVGGEARFIGKQLEVEQVQGDDLLQLVVPLSCGQLAVEHATQVEHDTIGVRGLAPHLDLDVQVAPILGFGAQVELDLLVANQIAGQAERLQGQAADALALGQAQHGVEHLAEQVEVLEEFAEDGVRPQWELVELVHGDTL